MFCNTFFETGSTKFHERIERPNLNWLRWPKSMSENTYHPTRRRNFRSINLSSRSFPELRELAKDK
jgi:hypothetical protein